MKISHLDHLVLTVADIENTCNFYQTVLGFEVITFKGDRKALKFGHQKINLHQLGNEFEPKALHPTSDLPICVLFQKHQFQKWLHTLIS